MESVSKIIKSLMIHEPYYGLFACSLNKRWSDKTSTAGVGTEGINFVLHINKDFWESIDQDERYGTIKHELLHLAFFHVTNKEMWDSLCPNANMLNVAMDLEVQSYIDERYWGSPEKYAAEGIFAKCPTLAKRQGTKYYIDFLKQVNNTPQGKGMSYNDRSGANPVVLSASDVQDIKDMMDQGSKDDHSVFGQATETQSNLLTTQLEWQLKEAYEQTMKNNGNIPGELQEMLKSLLKIKPPVFNWKAYLRRMIGFSYDVYYKKTRRKESNRFIDSYGLKHNKKHSILVAIDTSGSVSRPEYNEFFSELYHMWKSGTDIDVIECDTRITKKEKYKGKRPDFVYGGGGTSFVPAIDYYNDHRNDYTSMVYFTDGYGDQECCKPFGKVIWVISSRGNQDAKYPGYKICIPKENNK